MALFRVDYDEIRNKIRPGDVIAFSGKSNFSEIIKVFTRSAVSHVGIVLQAEILGAPGLNRDGHMNQVIESATINGKSAVTISRLRDRVNTYGGEMWWLPLGVEARAKVDAKLDVFYSWCLSQEGKQYDVNQALKAGLDALDRLLGPASLTMNKEDFTKFFCSELVAAALEETGALPRINASEVTPIDLCSFTIFAPDYSQIRGDHREIRGFNSVSPHQWMQSNGLAMAA